MTTMTVRLRGIGGTGACLGMAGPHTVVVDRPEGRAGGTGLGLNGGQLLALAIGGCLCNDIHYAAAELGIGLASLAVSVTLSLEGAPLLVTGAEVEAEVAAEDPAADTRALLGRAVEISTVANSLTGGIPIRVRPASGAPGAARQGVV